MNKELEAQAIRYLKMFEPEDPQKPYYLAYSGGKDSDTILILAQLAGVRFEAVHNLTTVDAPETVNYVKSKGNVRIDRPEKSMWRLIEEKIMPPTRIVRYCCSELKERGGRGRKVITGVRRDESDKRNENAGLVNFWTKPVTTKAKAEQLGVEYRETKKGGIILNNDNDESRQLVEDCYSQHKTTINPIVDWTDKDAWEFLHYYGCKSNPLYECGWKRIGCIGCPLASNKTRYAEFKQYPKYKHNYILAFDRMLNRRKEKGLTNNVTWRDGEDVFKWWMGEDPLQITFDELMSMYDGE